MLFLSISLGWPCIIVKGAGREKRKILVGFGGFLRGPDRPVGVTYLDVFIGILLDGFIWIFKKVGLGLFEE